MKSRLLLQAELEAITPLVYFQPPRNLLLDYPCIVYRRDNVNTDFADDIPYKRAKRYTITVIDRDPDSDIPDQVGALPACVHDRFYTADDLNHDAFRIFF